MKIFIHHIFIFLFFLCQLSTKAEINSKPVKLIGNLKSKSFGHKKIHISSFYGTQLILLDSTVSDKNGTFKFQLKIPNQSGYYRLSIGSTNYTDIILSPGENPIIDFENGELKNWLQVKNSHENKAILESRIISKKADSKTTIYNELVKIANDYPNTFFSKTTLAYLPYEYFLPDTFSSPEKKIIHIQNHYFDKVDFSTNELMYSTLLPNIFMRYLENYTQYDEEGFKASVDIIMKKVSVNEDISAFTLDFLIQLFKKVGPEIILEYVIENYYFVNSCGDSKQFNQETIQIIKDYGNLSEGNIVPDFYYREFNWENNTFSDSTSIYKLCEKNKLVLLVFWSSHCQFCALKSIFWNELFDRYDKKGLEIIYISLDSEINDLTNGIREKKLNGKHVCDFNGWQGSIVQKLKINRTPYLVLLSNEGKIILKDKGDQQINSYLSNYLD